MEEKVTISVDEYKRLLRSEAHLNELDIRGVDNWRGYVGDMFWCEYCDAESEWYEIKDYICLNCGKENDIW